MSSTTRTPSNGTRPRPAPRARAAVPDKPAKVALNVDTLEREGAPVEPFVAVVGGKPRQFLDPYEMDWQEFLVAVRDPRMMFRLALSDEDYREVVSERMPIWKFNRLSADYLEHYGIDAESLGNPAASLI